MVNALGSHCPLRKLESKHQKKTTATFHGWSTFDRFAFHFRFEHSNANNYMVCYCQLTVAVVKIQSWVARHAD